VRIHDDSRWRNAKSVQRVVYRSSVVLRLVTVPATSKITNMARGLGSAVVATARQMPKRRIVAMAAAGTVLVAVALLVPLPTAVQMRDWATSVGPWFPLAFLAAHIVVTVLPFPRTAFTLTAGLLFGPVLGVTLAVVASTASALIALALVRAAGWQLSRLVHHQAVETLDARLRNRGWPAVMSLRLIPAVPFSVLNYAVGASAVRVLPYTLATLAGVFPGTAAVVILGDALTGNVSPLLFLVSLCTGIAGLVLLAYEVRHHRRHHHMRVTEAEDAAEPAIPR
jgi:uncharacterized membrane protein YdjX (TVP38/TMEM64 family)